MTEHATLSTAQLQKLATLSRLSFTPEALTAFGTEFQNILNFVTKIQSAPTANVAPLTSMLALTQPEMASHTPERADAVTEPNQREALQASAPSTESGFFVVPKIVE
jgi:aspartyl-tRNA(Asn)/glutamyl-tRNA(Gln) amidotransferase subunit C